VQVPPLLATFNYRESVFGLRHKLVETETQIPTRIDSSWNSLLKVGGVSSVLAGVFLMLEQVFISDSNNLFNSYFSSQVATNSVISVPMLLSFIETNSNIYYGWYISYALAALFGLPALFALYVALRQNDKGIALIGSAFGVLGIGIIVANISNHFYLINESFVYDSGCTVCASQAVTGATATFAADMADSFGSLMLIVALIVLSAAILRGRALPRALGFFGLAVALVNLVITFVNTNYLVGFVPSFLLAIWLIAAGYSIVRLPLQRMPNMT
jgi:hypothetical protein